MMSIFTCGSAPEESRDKELLAPITQQLHAVSTVIDGLRERVVELSSECNSRIGDCAVRVRNMEKRLNKITDPLDSMSSDELQRILYILELIKEGSRAEEEGKARDMSGDIYEQVRRSGCEGITGTDSRTST